MKYAYNFLKSFIKTIFLTYIFITNKWILHVGFIGIWQLKHISDKYFIFPWNQVFFRISFINLLLQVVNRVQKLRKKSALEPTDSVEVYFKSLDDDASVSAEMLKSQVILELTKVCF